jgi:hypothetical protein
VTQKHLVFLEQPDPSTLELVNTTFGPKIRHFLMYELTIPLMSFSIYEENLFNSNITDYLFAEKKVKSEPLLRLKSSCFDLLSKLVVQDYQTYFTFIEFVEKAFQEPQNEKMQHGILFCLEQLEQKDFVFSTPIRLFTEEVWIQICQQSNLSKKAFIANLKSRLVENVVFKGLQSPSLFVRAKTCRLVGSLDQTIWVNSQQMVRLCELVCSCINEQNEVSRITSLMAIEFLVMNPECLPLLKASLPILIEKILEMLKLANLNDVIKSLYQIVKQFSEHILEFSMTIVDTLLSSFYQTTSAFDNEEHGLDFEFEKDETRNSLETSILTLNEILLLNLPDQFYEKSKDWVFQLFHHILITPSLSYLIDSALKLFNSFLFNLKHFDDQTWFFFPFICYILIENPSFSLPDMSTLHQKVQSILQNCQFSVLHSEIPDYHRFIGKSFSK